jgi:hypothetical protein
MADERPSHQLTGMSQLSCNQGRGCDAPELEASRVTRRRTPAEQRRENMPVRDRAPARLHTRGNGDAKSARFAILPAATARRG